KGFCAHGLGTPDCEYGSFSRRLRIPQTILNLDRALSRRLRILQTNLNRDLAYGRLSRRLRIQSGDSASLFQTASCCETPSRPPNRIVGGRAPGTLCKAFHTRNSGTASPVLQIARKCRPLGTRTTP